MGRSDFDGYAQKYDRWFLENKNIFESELELLRLALGDISQKNILSVGCGSGFFELALRDYGIEVTQGIEPSEDMANIAIKRGLDVKIDTIENVELEKDSYDVIYFNTSSTYIENLRYPYEKSYKALKKGGRLIILDIPKESAYGLMYLLGISHGTFNKPSLEGVIPNLSKRDGMIELLKLAHWHTTLEKVDILKDLNMKNFKFLQTLRKNPVYANLEFEETVEGYQSDSYVAIIAEK